MDIDLSIDYKNLPLPLLHLNRVSYRNKIKNTYQLNVSSCELNKFLE